MYTVWIKNETTTHVSNHEIDAVCVATDLSIENTGPDLRVGSKTVQLSADVEVQWLESIVLR
jgi:hypothetical protein